MVYAHEVMHSWAAITFSNGATTEEEELIADICTAYLSETKKFPLNGDFFKHIIVQICGIKDPEKMKDCMFNAYVRLLPIDVNVTFEKIKNIYKMFGVAFYD